MKIPTKPTRGPFDIDYFYGLDFVAGGTFALIVIVLFLLAVTP